MSHTSHYFFILYTIMQFRNNIHLILKDSWRKDLYLSGSNRKRKFNQIIWKKGRRERGMRALVASPFASLTLLGKSECFVQSGFPCFSRERTFFSLPLDRHSFSLLYHSFLYDSIEFAVYWLRLQIHLFKYWNCIFFWKKW